MRADSFTASADSNSGLARDVAQMRQELAQLKQEIAQLKQATQAAPQAMRIQAGNGIQISGSGLDLTISAQPRTGTVSITGICDEEGMNFTGSVTIQ